MKSSDRPRQQKRFRWVHTLLFVLVLFAVFHLGGQIHQYHQMLEIKAEYAAELEAATAIYEQKQEEIDLLSDDAYIARVAREKLGMLRIGEKPVVITEMTEEQN